LKEGGRSSNENQQAANWKKNNNAAILPTGQIVEMANA
jgi:hypothetical protein